jgi:polyvinyl alcohol dehydrogenase (cytochrome)
MSKVSGVGPRVRLRISVLARTAIAICSAGLLVSLIAPTVGRAQGASGPGTTLSPSEWPTYGHDAHHSFAGVTSLTPAVAPALKPAWFFPTGDAVTANPVVVRNTVYAGSWDGNFYAVDATTGKQRWRFAIKPQPAVSPRPGEQPRDVTSDGGLITSSAWFQPRRGNQPDLVIFGGGFTLYALNADTGALYWSHDYTGLPERPPDPANDETRIFSSPVVVGTKVLFGVSADGEAGHRGYIAAADLATGNPVWRFETDVDDTGQILNDGCGNIWSSPTIIEKYGLATLGVADCRFTNAPPYHETVIALRVADGSKAWVFRPTRPDPQCDFDFGATANLGTAKDGLPTFLGIGGKDGTYYSLDPATGAQRWAHNVVFGGFAGGFIATAAYDGRRVYGATALGDVGRFEGFGTVGCEPGNPNDQPVQEPSMHAFVSGTGQLAWQGVQSQSFGPTTVAGGMTFVGTGITRQLQIRDAATGNLLSAIPLQAPSDSGATVVRNAVIVGLGSSEQGYPAGIAAYTPSGVPPANG